MREDLTNKTFGKLTVIEYISNNGKNWKCKCECGNIHYINTYRLTHINNISCVKCSRQTHGYSSSITYKSWQRIKQSCYNINNHKYKNYGGRGIKVCDRWLDSFENFLEDMGERPEGMTLDRIDNNGDYEPSNCRWATIIEQNNNKRNNHYITYNNKTLTIAEWSRVFNISKNVIYARLRNNWNDIDAITIPVNKRRN